MSKQGFGNLKPSIGNADTLRLDEVVEMMRFPDNEDLTIRFLDSPVMPVRQHWIKILAGKEKREIKIPKYCIAFDPENEDTPKEGVVCPYCSLSGGKDGTVQTSTFYLANAIIREIQEDEPNKKRPYTSAEKKTGFKDIKSKSWTPVRVVRLPSTVVARLQELGERNKVLNKKTKKKTCYDVTHAKFGCDVVVRYKPKAPGTDKYSVDIESKTSITEEEEKYLTWDLTPGLLTMTGLETVKQAKEQFNRLDIADKEAVEDDEDEDGLDFSRKKKKKKGKKTSKSGFDMDDEDEDDEDEDDDDVLSTKKKKKKKPSKELTKKKKSRDDDEDEDEDDEDVLSTKKKKKPKQKPVKGKSVSSKKKKSKSKDEYDTDDEPKKKKKKSKETTKEKSKKKKRKTDKF